MSYRLRIAPRAADDLLRLFEFLQTFPLACRKSESEHPFLREMVISFGQAGYVALFEIDDAETVTVLAVRHQREDDLY